MAIVARLSRGEPLELVRRWPPSTRSVRNSLVTHRRRDAPRPPRIPPTCRFFCSMIYVTIICRIFGRASEASLYTLLQIFSVTLFEKMPLPQALSETRNTFEHPQSTTN
jgi:hypothetical protein